MHAQISEGATQGHVMNSNIIAKIKILLLYNKTLNKHVTALFGLYLGNVDTSANHFRNAHLRGPLGNGGCLVKFVS